MTRNEAIYFLRQLEELILGQNSWLTKTKNAVTESFGMAFEALKQPERKKGEWLMDGEKCGELMWRCSECRVSEAVPTATSFISGIAYPQWKFCPNCGADMREGEQDED